MCSGPGGLAGPGDHPSTHSPRLSRCSPRGTRAHDPPVTGRKGEGLEYLADFTQAELDRFNGNDVAPLATSHPAKGTPDTGGGGYELMEGKVAELSKSRDKLLKRNERLRQKIRDLGGSVTDARNDKIFSEAKSRTLEAEKDLLLQRVPPPRLIISNPMGTPVTYGVPVQIKDQNAVIREQNEQIRKLKRYDLPPGSAPRSVPRQLGGLHGGKLGL